MQNPRKIAVSILLKIEKESAFSNIAVSNLLKEAELDSKDKALVSALVYGVLDRKITLDAILSKFIKTPIKKTAPFTLQVLRTALYQILFMDKIPESAAVNEAVKLIKKSKDSRNAGFVNAVLRSCIREENLIPKGESPKEMEIRYSCPLWIIESFIKDYGIETARNLLEESLKPPPVTIRVNTLKTTLQSLMEELEKEGITSQGEGKTLFVNNGFNIPQSKAYQMGLFHIQDMASQKAVEILSPKNGERVLDLCAAPGGKSFTMAENMENEGQLISCDLYENRVKLISQNAQRLGINIIGTRRADASVYDSSLGLFDAILCDVPCSGLGVIRRKPDIKYKPHTDFKELEEIQYSILTNGVRYLKKGGRVLYSTCTLRKEENENLVTRFLSDYNDFHKECEYTFMPHIDGTDGFYAALLIKD